MAPLRAVDVGPFTLTFDMWINYKPTLKKINEMSVLKKDDCSFSMKKAPDGRFVLRAFVDQGAAGTLFVSEPFRFQIEKWHDVAFACDGKSKGIFRVDGHALEATAAKTENAPSLTAGEAAGVYPSFSGIIDRLRMYDGMGSFRPRDPESHTGVDVLDRTSFIRMEKCEGVALTIANNLAIPIANATLSLALENEKRECLDRVTMALPVLEPNGKRVVFYPLNTALKAGRYALKARVLGPGETPFGLAESFPIAIAKRSLPHSMPVVMYDGPRDIMREGALDNLKKLGFTRGCMQPRHWVDLKKIWKEGASAETAGPKGVARTKRVLNYALANDYKVSAYLRSTYPRHFPGEKGKYLARDHQGEAYPGSLCGYYQKVRDFSYDVGASIARTYGRFPGLGMVMLNDETVDFGIEPDFSEMSRKAYEKATGRSIPENASEERAKLGGVDFPGSGECPFDRIVPDDYPPLEYCRWFWADPNGQISLMNDLIKGLKSAGKNQFWTWYAPAVRYPYHFGSGGNADTIAEWTYSNPNPLIFGAKADELLAMRKGGRALRAIPMTQCFWYRSKTAPINKQANAPKRPLAEWEKNEDNANARFITISPDHLTEAFWCDLARPIQGLAYYGWSNLAGPGDGASAFTNSETKEALRDLTASVVKPLGATLTRVPDCHSGVALLESFTSQAMQTSKSVFTGMWKNAIYHIILQYAQLQPEVIYEESVLRDGLDSFKILVMPSCEVLPKGVVVKIREFQENGGIVVANADLCPAIKPDIELKDYRRRYRPDKDKAAFQEMAAELRKQLDAFYERPCDSSNPDVISRLRRYETTDYLFLINDKREFGDYVGHHGKVMEAGLPAKTRASVRRDGGFAYDLLKGKRVDCETRDGRMEFDVELPPGGGAIYMALDEEIAGVDVEGPEKLKRGADALFKISVLDNSGEPMKGTIIPVKVDIVDASGERSEFSGYYGVKDGVLNITLNVAENEPPGKWRIAAKELASGTSDEHACDLADSGENNE